MRIKIVHPVFARLKLSPGDELIIDPSTEGLESLLNSVRVDGAKFVRVLNDDGSEITVPRQNEETATVRGTRGRRSTSSS